MKRVVHRQENDLALGIVGLVVLMASLSLVAGCGPKRVTNTNPAVPKTKVTVSGPEPDPLLPFPTFKGRSGIAPGNAAITRQRQTSSGKKSPVGLRIANLAKKQLGKPYKWGAEGPDRFDCSGLALFVYEQVGIQLPRNSRSQAKVGQIVTIDNLKPGDLLFFATKGKTVNHVGIYVGGHDFIHAPKKHVPVSKNSLNNSFWRRALKVARRLG